MSDIKPPPRWLKPMNKVMMAIQSVGIPTGPAMVLTVPGRRSGQPRSTPSKPEVSVRHVRVHVYARSIGLKLLVASRIRDRNHFKPTSSVVRFGQSNEISTVSLLFLGRCTILTWRKRA